MKNRLAETEGKLSHLQVELNNEKLMIESLIKSKKELMATLNTYIIKCE